MEIKIKKASIKEGLFLDAEYERMVEENPRTVGEKSKAPIHDDLKNAFKKLDEHLCILCEQFNSYGDHDLENVSARGFVIGGSGDSEGVVLLGGRSLTGGYMNISSPFTKWESDYDHIGDLGEIIEECKHEVYLYLFENKHKEEEKTDQLALEFEHEEDI